MLDLLLITAVYLSLTEPLTVKMADLKVTITRIEQDYLNNIDIINRKDLIQAEYDKIVFKGSRKTDPGKRAGDWLKAIEQAAGNAVLLENITPGSPQTRKSYKVQSFKLDCSGELSDLTKFIYNILQSNQMLKIEMLQLSADPASPAKLKCILTINKISL